MLFRCLKIEKFRQHCWQKGLHIRTPSRDPPAHACKTKWHMMENPVQYYFAVSQSPLTNQTHTHIESSAPYREDKCPPVDFCTLQFNDAWIWWIRSDCVCALDLHPVFRTTTLNLDVVNDDAEGLLPARRWLLSLLSLLFVSLYTHTPSWCTSFTSACVCVKSTCFVREQMNVDSFGHSCRTLDTLDGAYNGALLTCTRDSQ